MFALHDLFDTSEQLIKKIKAFVRFYLVEISMLDKITEITQRDVLIENEHFSLLKALVNHYNRLISPQYYS